jgi:hypothetical protein
VPSNHLGEVRALMPPAGRTGALNTFESNTYNLTGVDVGKAALERLC